MHQRTGTVDRELLFPPHQHLLPQSSLAQPPALPPHQLFHLPTQLPTALSHQAHILQVTQHQAPSQARSHVAVETLSQVTAQMLDVVLSQVTRDLEMTDGLDHTEQTDLLPPLVVTLHHQHPVFTLAHSATTPTPSQAAFLLCAVPHFSLSSYKHLFASKQHRRRRRTRVEVEMMGTIQGCIYGKAF
jgi:hypothetical protein